MKILVDILIIIAVLSVIYIAYYLLRIDLKNKQINDQFGEEKDDCQRQLYELTKRVVALEKELKNEERDNTRKDKTSNKPIRRNR